MTVILTVIISCAFGVVVGDSFFSTSGMSVQTVTLAPSTLIPMPGVSPLLEESLRS